MQNLQQYLRHYQIPTHVVLLQIRFINALWPFRWTRTGWIDWPVYRLVFWACGTSVVMDTRLT
jgi:hypothetical protein